MAIASLNPATGELVREFTAHTPAEIEERIAAAADAFARLRRTDFATRAGWMHAAADLLDAEAEEVAAMITLEMGKPLAQARAEAKKSAGAMRFYADRAESFLSGHALDDPSAVGASSARTTYQPLGVVLAVMPWNYPIWQVVRFAAPALMAGNTGLLKHASNVPQSALYLDTLFERAGFPAGSFHALLIPAGAVEAVLRDPRVTAVTLTGSEPAGRSVAAIAGSEVKHVVLELGGSDPFVVMPSADLDRAVATAVASRTTNNGQACINAKRFIVHADVYDAFVEKFTDAMAALRVGDPTDAETEVGPLATSGGRDDLAELVDDALGKGAVATVATLYYFAALDKLLVAGTGNKVEDFGVGFYTKYGDGGVDISPIADLLKSEVYLLAKELEIMDDIVRAAPTDGLWGDDRSDEDQLGASYPELEWAMEMTERGKTENDFYGREQEIIRIFKHLNKVNQHKMVPIPVCEIPNHLKTTS